MGTNLKGSWLVLGLTLLALPGAARADLLDDEEPAVGKDVSKEASKASGTDATPSDNDASSSGSAARPRPAPPAEKKEPPVSARVSDPSIRTVPPKNPGKKPAPRPQEPVHFGSKGLKGLREKGMVELTQEVVVTQGDMRLEADHAEVFFDEGTKGASGLIKVVADGNVKIFGVDENSGDRFKAFSNQAVFLSRERKVLLDGNARLWRGDDSVIRSKKITYEIDSGWIQADRVAGELAPGDKPK